MRFCPQCGHKLITPPAGLTDTVDTETRDYTIETKAKTPEPSPGIKRGKLYKQWVKYSGLPDEEVPLKKAPSGMLVRGERNKLSPGVLYLLFGVTIVILCVVVVLLVVRF
jgi:hypothetical protein